jgi:hypothetical protein
MRLAGLAIARQTQNHLTLPLLPTYSYLSFLLGRLRPMGSLFGSFSPRGARSKGNQQPDGRVAHNQKLPNILGVDIGILAT